MLATMTVVDLGIWRGGKESCNDSRGVQRHSPTRKILKVEVFFMGFKAHLATCYPRFLASEYRFLQPL